MSQPTVAWVTGASSGLGHALSLRLARDAWHVAVSARRHDDLAHLANATGEMPGTVLAYPLDVTENDKVNATCTRIEQNLGPIDLAVLNAGTHRPVSASTLAPADFRALVELNLMGTVNCLCAVLPGMIERQRGRIAIVASLSGYRGLPSAAAYGMTKAGLINLAEALKPELDRLGVTIQVINPGFVKTPLTDRNRFPMPFLISPEAAAEHIYRGLKSKRFDIAFPWQMATLLKILRILPDALAFRITSRLAPDS